MLKLSKELEQMSASGDFGEALDGLHERVAALEIERDALKAEVERLTPLQFRPAPCYKFCESMAFKIEIKQLKAELKATESRLHEVAVGCANAEFELEKAKAKASKAQELADWHLSHRTLAESQLEAARKQEPFAYCFTDVNGKPTQFTDAPKYSHPNDLRVIKPLYARPVPAHQAADNARYAVDPIYDKGEYYITGADINEILKGGENER